MAGNAGVVFTSTREINKGNFPKGCFMMDGGRLFVNKGGGADCSESNTCVCKQTPKATTTTTTTTPRAAGPYLLSSGKCPEGDIIPKKKKCKKAAKILGVLNGKVDKKGFKKLAKGCVLGDDGNVKLSKKGEGNCGDGGQCICLSKGPPPAPAPAGAAANGPTKLDSGDCATVIADADACKNAAADLGVTYKKFVNAKRKKWPAGCWFWKNKLWYNIGKDGKTKKGVCGKSGSYCICA